MKNILNNQKIDLANYGLQRIKSEINTLEIDEDIDGLIELNKLGVSLFYSIEYIEGKDKKEFKELKSNVFLTNSKSVKFIKNNNSL